MKENREQCGRAFSLMELLIAIAVIAIVAMLLVPVIARVRRGADATRCTAGLRNIAQGMSSFVADKGYYPGRVADRRPTFWYEALEPYVTGQPVPRAGAALSIWLRCPARKGLPYEGVSSQLGYGYNMYFGNIPLDHSGFDPESVYNSYWHLTPARVRNPGQTILLGDSRDDGVTSAFVISALRGSTSATDALHPRRHGGGGNFLFADGHVEWMTPKVLTERIRQSDGAILKP